MLRAAISSLSEALCVADASGRIVETNDEFKRYHRFRIGEPAPQSLDELHARCEAWLADGTPITPSQWPLVRALGGETGANVVYRLRRAGGVEMWWGSYNFAPIRDNAGEIIGAVATARDMTETKRIQDELFAAKARLEALMDALPVGVTFSDDSSCEHITGNRTAKAQFEVGSGDNLSATAPDDRAFGRHMRIFRDGQLVEGKDLPLQRAVAEGRTIPPVDLHIVLPSGKTWWASTSAAPLRDHTGALIGGVAVTVDVTQQKLADDNLLRSEERYRALHEGMRDAFAEVALDGRIIDCNEAYCRLVGYTKAELARMTYVDLTPPDFHEKEAQIVNNVMSRGYSDVYEKEYRHKDGRIIPVELRAILRTDPDGRPQSIWGMIRDISERKRHERALAESEHRYRSLVRAASAFSWSCPPDGFNTDPQPEWMAFTGQTAEEMYGHGWGRAIHPDDMATVIEKWTRAVERKHPFAHEYRLRRHDGAWRWMDVQVVPVKDASQDVIEWFGMCVDVTDRKEAELALAESERLFRGFLSATADVVYRMSPDWSEMQYLVGHDFIPDTLEPSTTWLSRYIPRSDQKLVQAMIGRAIETKGNFEFEHRVIAPDGSMRWTSSRAIPVLNSDGTIGEWFGTASDITRRKNAEEALQNAHNTLRHLVEHSPFGIYVVDSDFRVTQVSQGAKRTFETVDPVVGRNLEDVLHSLWPERFASEAIERFRWTLLSGESYHAPSTEERRKDINATEAYDWRIDRITMPDGRYGVVCHFYDLTERRRHEEHVELLMREVNHRSKNMLGLVQAIARQTAACSIEEFLQKFEHRVRSLAGAQDLLIQHAWKEVPLRDLILKQLSHFSDLIGTRILITGPSLNFSAAAAQAIGIALHELTTNASKYGSLSNETGRVEIAWSLCKADEPFLNLSWIERGGPAVRPPEKHGFGSTVTTRLVQMSTEGDVSTDYAPEGLSWQLRCPARSVLEGGRTWVPPVEQTNGRSHDAAATRILLVEDEPLIASELKDALAEAGYIVLGPAPSVAHAALLMDRETVDAAVIDVNLGRETSELIAQRLLASQTPFVVVSGYARSQVPDIFQSAPYVGKPIVSTTLIAELKGCIGPVRSTVN